MSPHPALRRLRSLFLSFALTCYATAGVAYPSADIDANGLSDALTDGLLVYRHLSGSGGNALTDGAVGPGAGRTGAQMEAYLGEDPLRFDIDGNGTAAPNDGLLLARYLFGFRGDTLVRDALGAGATRDAADIESYVQGLLVDIPGSSPPPAPETVAPPLPQAVYTSFFGRYGFMLDPQAPLQFDVADGAIGPQQAAIVRGRVLDPAGNPLGGVRVSAFFQAQAGWTLSRNDGSYDLMVNGGGNTVVRFERADRLTVDRTVALDWQEVMEMPTVRMLAVDSVASLVPLGSGDAFLHTAGAVTDASGSRAARLFIPAGTSAEMHLADGSTLPLPRMTLHATEFTVGPDGPEAMPAPLPLTTAYTYALEYSVDEALAAGAVSVQFDRPLYHYNDNFLGFPVGAPVPTGFYDRELARWVASDNGLIIAVLGVSGGLARVDLTGDGLAADAQALADAGFSDAELGRLAANYAPGDTLWRVPISHFTPFDCNWPFGPPRDARVPRQRGRDPEKRRKTPPCDKAGSVIDVVNQTVIESVPLAGSPVSLNYSSDRVPGRRTVLEIPFDDTGGAAASLAKIHVGVSVAGQTHHYNADPATDATVRFEWDGLDGYGRPVPTAAVARYWVDYTYPGNYLKSGVSQDRAFGLVADSAAELLVNPDRMTVGLRTNRELLLPNADARRWGLGGWTLSLHHHYDPVAGWLYEGTGRIREVELQDIKTSNDYLTPTGTQGVAIAHVTAAPDGGFYYVRSNQILRQLPDGTVVEVMGFGSRVPEEGGAAHESRGVSVQDMLVDRDGSLIVVQKIYLPYLFRIDTDGIIHIIRNDSAVSGIVKAAMAADGTLYVARDRGSFATVYRLLADSTPQDLFDVASDAVSSMAVDARGQLHWSIGAQIFRQSLNGDIEVVAGTGAANYSGDGGPATAAELPGVIELAFGADGNLYIFQSSKWIPSLGVIPPVVRAVDGAGIIRTVIGGPDHSPLQYAYSSFAITSGQRVVVAEKQPSVLGQPTPPTELRYFSLGVSVGGDANTPLGIANSVILPSADGTQAYLFDASDYRHLSTLNAYTGETLYRFGYDAAGHLTAITDAFGQVTRIERDAAGNATAIVAPHGQRTLLTTDANGYIGRIASESGPAYTMTYDGGGLLSSSTDPNLAVHRFAYDDLGRLVMDTGPENAVTRIAASGDGDAETVTLTDPLGLVTRYDFAYDPDGIRRTRTLPDGSSSVWRQRPDGTTELTHGDGTHLQAWYEPDARWGDRLGIPARLEVSLPSGLGLVREETRAYAGLVRGAPFSFSAMTQTFGVDGAAHTLAFDRANRTWTSISPEGEVRQTVFDQLGELQQASLGSGIDPVVVVNDAQGEFTGLQWGSRNWSLDYDAGLAVSLTDPAGGITRITYDEHGYPVARVQPSGRTVEYVNDASGRPLEYRLAGGAVHTQTFSGNGNLASYAPPGAATAMVRVYNGDRQLHSVDMPGGAQVLFDYDAHGEITGIRAPETTASFGYSPATGFDSASSEWTNLLTHAGHATTFHYDGFLATGKHYSGSAAGAVTYTHDASFRPTNIRVEAAGGTADLPVAFDLDSEPASIGGFAVTRSGPARQASGYSDGVATVALEYDNYGQLTRKAHAIGGNVFYQEDLEYDDLGRVTGKIETTAAGQHGFAYDYNADGSLLAVRRDGADFEAYGYDERDNRLSASYGQGPAQPADYDLQDRLTQRNGIVYQSNDDGYVTGRGGDGFEYAARGELLAASIGGNRIDYVYDAFGRQVARVDAGGQRTYLYGLPGQPYKPLAAVDADDNLLLFVYDDQGRLLAIDRAGTRYYVGSDHLGSPRVVVDAGGQVVKRLDYDAFGRVLESYGAPGSDLDIVLGFAGGIADAATGLVRFGMRDYEPASGRWMARDPILFQSRQTNLYAYVGNSPMSYTDPSGLICVGGSLYDIVGGGGELCATWDGISACGEIGFGYGKSFGIKPHGGLAQWGNKIKAELSADLGFMGINVKGELTDCGKLTAGWETSFFDQTHGHQWSKTGGSDWEYDLDNLKQNWQTSGKIDTDGVKEFVKSKVGSAKREVEGKVAAEFCGNLTW